MAKLSGSTRGAIATGPNLGRLETLGSAAPEPARRRHRAARAAHPAGGGGLSPGVFGQLSGGVGQAFCNTLY